MTPRTILQSVRTKTKNENDVKTQSIKLSSLTEREYFRDQAVSAKNITLQNSDNKSLLFSHLMKKTGTIEKGSILRKEMEEDKEVEENHKGEDKSEMGEDIENMTVDQIVVVKKGMKVTVKGELDFDENRKTALEEILQKRESNEEFHNHLHNYYQKEEVKPPKTTLPPYSLMREMQLNVILLEGKIDDEDEEKENEKNNEEEAVRKAELMKNFVPGTTIEDDDDIQNEKENQYLEKFKYRYRSNVIATGTISIVSTLKNTEGIFNIPNPQAELYDDLIRDEDSETMEEEQEQKTKRKDESPLKRNDVLLPGTMFRQGINANKNVIKNKKTQKKYGTIKNTTKKKVKENEEQSEENAMKRLILDIPKGSTFYKTHDIDEFKKEMEEDDMLEEGEDDQDELESNKESEKENDEMEDIFLDRYIDFDVEIDRAAKASAKRRNDKVEWSGQDIKPDYDPYFAKIAAGSLSNSRVYTHGFRGVQTKLRGYLMSFVGSALYNNFMILLVVANTIALSLDYHGNSESNKSVLLKLNLYFTITFVTEFTLKLIGLGPIAYLKDKMNYLDRIVVILSIFELAFLSGGGALSAFRAVRVMTVFRVFRATRIIKSMKSMKIILDVIIRSISSFLYLALLLLLFIFIYAILGMQIFGGKFNFDDGVPRGNFDTFNSAFITAFQVMTVENWNEILHSCMRSDVNKFISAIYLISWIFLGNFMLLNLFLAILLNKFVEEGEVGIRKKSPEEIKEDEIEAKQEFMSKTGENLILCYSDIAMNDSNNKRGKGGGFIKQIKKKGKNDNLMGESFALEDVALKRKKAEVKEKKPDYWGIECQRSFYLLDYNNVIRKIFYKMTNHYLFESVVLALIVLSSILLTYDTYIIDNSDSSPQKRISNFFDLFFTLFFLFEAVSKCISQGFVQDRGSYLRESWNQFDFFIVCVSIFDLAFSGIDIPAIRILRLLRTLRPLRFISHNSNMKLIVTALFESIGYIINVVVVMLIVWLMFAILAVKLFSGKLYYCTIDTYEIRTEKECRLVHGEWGPYDANFDSVPNSILTLFIISTLERWPNIMYQAVDGQGKEVGPKVNASPLAAYFFVIFIFIGSFLFLNFFVGAMFLNFDAAQKAEKESWLMTKSELEWVDIMKMIVKAKPDLETTNVPKNKFKRILHVIVTSTAFDIFIMVCIVLNMVQMGMTYEGESTTYANALQIINYAFTSVFVIEATMKLIAFGRSYFQSSWNIFDFIVVLGSLFDIILSNMNASQLTFPRDGPQLIRILRVFRVSRLLRLINKYPGLQALIKTIMFSLPSLFNVFLLIMLIFFIFAILGVFLFHEVKSGDIIDNYSNFSDFGHAMVMLIRASTGENWPTIMFDLSRTGSS